MKRKTYITSKELSQAATTKARRHKTPAWTPPPPPPPLARSQLESSMPPPPQPVLQEASIQSPPLRRLLDTSLHVPTRPESSSRQRPPQVLIPPVPPIQDSLTSPINGDDHLENPPTPQSCSTPIPNHSTGSNTNYRHSSDISYIYVENKKFLPDGNSIARNISSVFSEKQDPTGYTWSVVNADMKTFYWQDFERIYSWNPSDAKVIKATWNRVASTHYNQTLAKWRSSWKRKKSIPEGVKEEIWNSWLKKWESEDWKKKSEQASKNRNSEPCGPGTGVAKHTGGSKSALEHAKTMVIEGGVNEWTFFRKFHMRKDGEFVDSKSRITNDKIQAAVDLASQPLEDGTTPVVDINAIYYDVVGGEKKRRVYGLGSQASVFYPRHLPSTSTPSNCSTSDDVKRMMESLKEQHEFLSKKEEAITEKLNFLSEKEKTIEEKMEKLERMQQDCLRGFQSLNNDM
ncbi:uncharacterized protein LOC126680571 [Mercurialis annua]|uniref:uncharacterized protein LOC126680571 n=1 Tax=Mercurialis annua TaxID=3986 RepID=UPI0024ACAF99|nr:uncharacterized protein LOC126680571 [Mercurialis annua]